jgi:tetratricopeptide (TPR) repeat protein/predicted Ser/Thr protein kinase
MNLTPQEAQRLAGILLDEDPADAALSGGRLPPGPFSRYRITRLVGVGGMGEVYEAQQENPDRRVAIKVIRPDQVSPELLRRFEHETRVLAKLQHPGIAPIYEAGQAPTAAGAVPFFAMEFVEGRPLTASATDSNLPIKARLELFLAVCDAVEHAHQKGIIHRDLKPANILIDQQGRPRILDFGIARATDSDIRTTTMHTEVGKLVGTLPYMSPEQAVGDPDELDTRSDVYSLGVILYELLSGRPPYDFNAAGRRLIPQALRAILETDPAPLSSVNRVFRGDLETIVGKALAKEKERRYQSVAELATDVRSFLADHPVVARPPSRWYQVCKFTRRNRGLVAGMMVAMLALLAGMTASTVFALQEGRAKRLAEDSLKESGIHRKEAERQATVAKATLNFILDMLAAAAPEGQGRDVRVASVMDSAVKVLDQQPLPDVEEESAMRETIGNTYVTLGNYPAGIPQIRQAFDLRQRAFGRDDPETILTLLNLAEAVTSSRETDPSPLYQDALERSTRVNGPDAPATLRCKRGVAIALARQGKSRQAKAVLQGVLEEQRRTLGNEHADTLASMSSLANVLKQLGDFGGSEQLCREQLSIREKLLGSRHPETLASMNRLAMALEAQGKLDDAEALMARVVAAARESLGERHTVTLEYEGGLGAVYRSERKLQEAEDLYRPLLLVSRDVRGTEHPDTLLAMVHLGAVLKDRRKLDEAAALFAEALEIERRILGDRDPQTLDTIDRLASTLSGLKSFERAESLARELVDSTAAASGTSHPDTLLSKNTLARVLKDEGKLAEAADIWRQLVEVEAPENLPANHQYTLVFQTNYGRCLIDLERFEEAEQELVAVLDACSTKADQVSPRARGAIEGLIQLAERRGQTEQAERYRAILARVPSASK